MNAPISSPACLTDGRPDVLVVVVTFNSAGVIEELLRSLPGALNGAPPARLVVVDNRSGDETCRLVTALAPWATLIDAGGNLGYAGAINIAIHEHPPRQAIYVLNPDTIPSPGSVAELAQAASHSTDTGILVPEILEPGGRRAHSLRRAPSLLRAFGEAVLGGTTAAHFPRLGEVVIDPAAYRDGARADWATGAAMYITAEAADLVGPWDERFFLYSEETDFALRAADVGLALRFAARASVTHIGGDLGTSSWLWSLMSVNRVRLYRKRHGRLATGLYWLVLTSGEAIRAAAGRQRSRAALRALVRLTRGEVPLSANGQRSD